MGRWRAPQPAASPYITAEGFAVLQTELKSLWARRTDVVAALSAAAAEGDRSENAEYIYRKKELAGIDRRIRYLQKRLPNLNVVTTDVERDQVFFGAWVTLDGDGEEFEYRIVGADEANARERRISIDSPLARALLKKSVGDSASVEVDDCRREYEIRAIRYGATS